MQSQPPMSLTNPFPPQSSHSRWLALTRREPSFHSSFFYGVKSTKIYCRPTCTARLARRANIVFYDTAEQARQDGYRPCKRCEPDNMTFIGRSEEVVTSVLGFLRRTRLDDSVRKRGLKEVAQEVGVTPSYLCRIFKKTMGITVGEYLNGFEREVGAAEMDSSVQSHGEAASGILDGETGMVMPATIVEAAESPVERREGEPVEEEDVGNDEVALDLDLDFDDWFWSEYSDHSIYGWAIEGPIYCQ